MVSCQKWIDAGAHVISINFIRFSNILLSARTLLHRKRASTAVTNKLENREREEIMRRVALAMVAEL